MKVLFRVHADAQVGLGHLQRCLSLALALRQSGEDSHFLVSGAPKALERVREFGFQAVALENAAPWGREDQRQIQAAAKSRQVQAVVVDSDEEGQGYLSSLLGEDWGVCAIEDANPHPFPCHLVVNGDAHAASLAYRSPLAETRFLLGMDYCILRPEFWEGSSRRRGPAVEKVLVMMGGADPRGLTPRVIRLLDGLPGRFEVQVCVGPFFQNTSEIRQAADFAERRVECLQSPTRVRDLFMRADLAVTGAGQTLYELARVGCPAVAVCVASNQEGQLAHLVKAGCARSGGSAGQPEDLPELRQALLAVLPDGEARLAMSEAGPRLVDGQGALRVAREIASLPREMSRRAPTSLRPAKEEDCRLFWLWRNEPETRKASFREEAIPYENHEKWFRQRLASPDTRLFVVVGPGGLEVGYLRFDLEGPSAQVSVSVDPSQRGRGYAAAAVRQGIQRILSEEGIRRVVALIKPDNARSLRLFERAGFREEGKRRVQGSFAVEMSYQGGN